MILFEKLCDACRNIKTVKHIESTDEFFAILQEVKMLLANGNYEYIGGNDPAVSIKHWPQDGLWYRVKCKNCGAFFTVWYDTVSGKGHFKKGK